MAFMQKSQVLRPPPINTQQANSRVSIVDKLKRISILPSLFGGNNNSPSRKVSMMSVYYCCVYLLYNSALHYWTPLTQSRVKIRAVAASRIARRFPRVQQPRRAKSLDATTAKARSFFPRALR